jgi:metal-responsive CopG/Arc/MetJ family transcriptional regulator
MYITVWLPRGVVEIIDKVKEKRLDPRRSDTIRFLLLKALADMSFLPEDPKHPNLHAAHKKY